MGDRADALGQADDRIVAGRVMDGDVEAFAVLVRRYTPMMRAYAHQILDASADVDDVVQEAFVVAWQHFDELQEPAKVKSWLMRILGRKAIDRVRARRPQRDLDEHSVGATTDGSPSHIVEARAELEALGTALRDLPAEQRECWVLRELGGCSYEEVAEQLDLPVSTVRGQLARARKYIIVRMEEWR